MQEKDRTTSIWDDVGAPRFPALDRSLKTSVCVVGGGITGVTVAFELAKRGHEVVLVEAFRLGSGQTSRTTAHLTFQLEEQFNILLKHLGEENLRTFMEAHRWAVDYFEDVTREENIDCDFARLDGHLFLGRKDNKELLRKEIEAAKKLGLDLDYVEETPLLTHRLPSVRFPRQGRFHPLKFLTELVRSASRKGVQFFEGTHVSEVRTTKENCIVMTEAGHEVSADHLVVCTHSPINNRFHIHTKQSAYRTYAMTFRWDAPVNRDVLLWDTEDPYHYVRFQGDRVIVGGEDHRTGQTPEHDPFYELEKWSRANLPVSGEILERWSGQVFEPSDQLPFIGLNPGEKRVYVSTGESGIGVTSAAIAANLIPDLLEGKDHPWRKLFDPSRSPVRYLKHYIKENFNTAAQYSDWVAPSEVSKWSAIPEDKGAVIREGLGRSCVYHLEGDEFEKKSAVCTHLGGIVHWNDVEKTWDCPCHGSRFNIHGTVIDGPAISNLQDS